MKSLKILGLGVIVSAFLFGLFVDTSYAQPGKARWNRNQGNHKGWKQGNHNGWNRGRKTGWQRNNRSWRPRQYNRISPREYTRLQRQRGKIYNSRSRYYRDGYLNNRERRSLNKQYSNYRRSVYRARKH